MPQMIAPPRPAHLRPQPAQRRAAIPRRAVITGAAAGAVASALIATQAGDPAERGAAPDWAAIDAANEAEQQRLAAASAPASPPARCWHRRVCAVATQRGAMHPPIRQGRRHTTRVVAPGLSIDQQPFRPYSVVWSPDLGLRRV